MLIIAPDLIEAMLEILQKTRSLATALAVVELQQQIIQAVYIKVRPSLFLFVCVCVCPLSSLLPVCPRVDDCMGAPTFRRMHLPALPYLAPYHPHRDHGHGHGRTGPTRCTSCRT